MTGNYGGEILRQLLAFKPVKPAVGLFRPEFLSYVDEAPKTYAGLAKGHPLSFVAFRQTPWHHYGLLALEQTQLSLRSPYLDNDLVRTAFRAADSAIAKSDAFKNGDDCVRLIGDGNQLLSKIRTDRGFGGSSGRLPAAVARGMVEVTVTGEYAYDYRMPQRMALNHPSLSWFHLER